MGGGSKYPYPQWVWSYYGGWWPQPKHGLRNSVVTAGIVVGLTAVAWNFSANQERRHRYPDRWIPSMLWARDFNDPEFKKQWQEQLAKEGREWIEPIPEWWPFKKRQE
ncbi:hypothetical protein DFS34DRAFT_627671 [Phlyctochytrium arcticum]|nr:hypothetical protein DFS34DRAFT_627671 [Phlyctochytrium arcticum]